MHHVKKIAILGSTGSIGQQVLEVVRALPDKCTVLALAGGNNYALLERQISEFQPKMFWSSAKVHLGHGAELMSMEEMVSHSEVDMVIIATSGKAGLSPTLAALKAGKTVALANKESLVMAGEIIIDAARRHQAQILPIDSEHSAIWQCLQGEKNEPRRLFLTASGGPFYHHPQSQLSKVTVEQALQHPIWRMGKKITIDSATLMNKGLEVIEAHWLFAIPFDNIEIVIHPQSVIHSMVEFIDGSIKAQLGLPDMRLPIQYALSHPDRWPNSELKYLDLNSLQTLDFEPADDNRFPCLQLAVSAGKAGGTYPAALCAADEVAVESFLTRQIAFTDIPIMVQETLERHDSISRPSIDEILAADAWAREYAMGLCLEHCDHPPAIAKSGLTKEAAGLRKLKEQDNK
jgi:1-deoxy-D-xylulose-5-phosphate reductoisomerase